jgi:hypothetical protein
VKGSGLFSQARHVVRIRSPRPDDQDAQGHNCGKKRGEERQCDKVHSGRLGVVDERERKNGDDWWNRRVRDRSGPRTFFAIRSRPFLIEHAPSGTLQQFKASGL